MQFHASRLDVFFSDKVDAHVDATGKVPAYYTGHLQQNFAVSGCAAINCRAWLPGKMPMFLTVPREDADITPD